MQCTVECHILFTMNSIFETTINCDGEDLDVMVEYFYHGGCFGAVDSKGIQVEPDIEPEVVIESVTDRQGNDVIITPEQDVELQELINKELIQVAEQYYPVD